MTTHLLHIVLTCRGAPVDTSGGDLEGGKQMKVRNVIRGGVVVAFSVGLALSGVDFGLTSSRSATTLRASSTGNGPALISGPSISTSTSPSDGVRSAAVALPQTWFGSDCAKVSSQGNFGQICILVNKQNIGYGFQGLVRFNSYSGAIQKVSATDLVLNANGNPVRYTDYVSKGANNVTNGFISTKWFYAVVPTALQAVVQSPCITWVDGVTACWPGSWHGSSVVQSSSTY